MKELRKQIRQIIEECENDWDAAIDVLVDNLENDPTMYEEYVRPMIRTFAKNEVYNIGHVARSQCWNSVGKKFEETAGTTQTKGVSGEDGHKGIVGDIAVGLKNIHRMLDMPLNKCKKKLGEADQEDLSIEINMYLDHARSNHEKAVFYKEVQSNLVGNEKVRDCFTEESIQSLALRVQREVRQSWDREKAEEPEIV
jgi:hypothetical protein